MTFSSAPYTSRWRCRTILVGTMALLGTTTGVLADQTAPLSLAPVTEVIPDSAKRQGEVFNLAERAAEQPFSHENDIHFKKSEVGKNGQWIVPSQRATRIGTPHSGQFFLINKQGDSSMGIGFPKPVTVDGAWFGAQGNVGARTTGVRAIGYLNGEQVAATEWFTQIGDDAAYFQMNLKNVDRIVIESQAVLQGAGWYSMDDLTFTTTTADGQSKQTVLDFEDLHHRSKLTGSDYGGLTWETGTGGDAQADAAVETGEVEAMPAPTIPEGQTGDLKGDTGESEPTAGGRGIGTPPSLIIEFEGARMGESGGFSYPADTCGEIGPNHFCEIVNRSFSVYNKNTGAKNTIYSISTLFSPFSTSGDPRILYDQHSGRWFALSTDFNNGIQIAVSATDDPLGSWGTVEFNPGQGSDAGRWPDYPTWGVDADGLYCAAFMVGGPGHTIFAIDKAPLLTGTPSLGTITAFRNLPFQGAIQPCHTYGTPGDMHLVATATSNTLRIYRVAKPITSPSLSNTSVTVAGFSEPPDAPALSSSVNLDTVGSRLMNAVYRDGSIWTAHCINISGRAAARWYEIDENSNGLIQSGTVSDAQRYYYFPSISVNEDGQAAMAFTGSKSDEYASCYYTGRLATDGSGDMATPILYHAGAAAQNNIDGAGRNRWGDYSQTSVDPVDNTTFFTVQKYGRTNNRWGTRIARLAYDIGPANDFCSAATFVGDGTHPFSNIGANTDGPTEAGECASLQADVWFLIVASCDGDLTVDTCDADYDSEVAIYGGSCPAFPGNLIACSDDDCGTGGTRASVTFPANENSLYRIRIGGKNGAEGSGNVTISCDVPNDCPADIAGNDGVVNTDDFLAVLAAWGACPAPCPPNCPEDIVLDCDINTDDFLAVLAGWGPCTP